MKNYLFFIKHKNTDPKYKNAVKKDVLDLQKKVIKNKAFFNNFTFHICDSYEDLETNSFLTKYVSQHPDEFRYTGGMTLPKIENNNKREIIVKTSNSAVFNIQFKKSVSDVEQAAMHEIGHQFDDYFGNCNANLLAEIKKIPPESEFNKKQEDLYNKYLSTKDLSDSKEFKCAWKKDAENLGKNTFSNYWFRQRHLDYYIFDVDITDGVTDKEVDEADFHRSEIFAQLFSYAMGQDDGQKKDIVEKFKNCYKQVKQYIEQFFGIKCKN